MEVAIPDNRAYAGQYGDLVELVAMPIGQGASYRVFGALYANVDGGRRLLGLVQAADLRCVRDGTRSTSLKQRNSIELLTGHTCQQCICGARHS